MSEDSEKKARIYSFEEGKKKQEDRKKEDDLKASRDHLKEIRDEFVGMLKHDLAEVEVNLEFAKPSSEAFILESFNAFSMEIEHGLAQMDLVSNYKTYPVEELAKEISKLTGLLEFANNKERTLNNLIKLIQTVSQYIKDAGTSRG